MRNHGVEQTQRPHTRFLGFWFSAGGAVVRRPHLWWTAVRQMFRLRPSDWWSRSPYLPLPSRAYVRFRLETAYGAHGTPRAFDVIRYLEWCRDTQRARAA